MFISMNLTQNNVINIKFVNLLRTKLRRTGLVLVL